MGVQLLPPCNDAAGTVEQAFGGKICCLINELSDATEDDDLQEIQNKVDKVMLEVLLESTSQAAAWQHVPCQVRQAGSYSASHCLPPCYDCQAAWLTMTATQR